MFSKREKPKTTTVSSVVHEDVDKWIRARAKDEGVTPSLWISDLLSYCMMTDGMTKGALSEIVHEFLHISDLAKSGRQFNFNPWSRSAGYPVSRVRNGSSSTFEGGTCQTS